MRTGILVLAIAIIAGYASWRSLAYAKGPSIEISTPPSGTVTSSSTIEIAGKALRINSLAINGNPLSVDETGGFKDTLAIFPGVNIVTLSATDQFGRSTEVQIQIVGKDLR
ncbi:MAG: hypothetical protein JWO00_532 [Candidatus Parcubacteria bacterium]|nr:hypothetical protein [Candidatus Parcubacteria bacterium]